MSLQSKLTAGRNIILGTAAHAAGPADGTATTDGTLPDFIMSPVAMSGLPTTGLLLILKSPSAGGATALAGGFTITPWIFNPDTNVWGSGAATSIGYNEAWVTYDIDTAALYFQIGNVNAAGNIYFNLMEQ